MNDTNDNCVGINGRLRLGMYGVLGEGNATSIA